MSLEHTTTKLALIAAMMVNKELALEDLGDFRTAIISGTVLARTERSEQELLTMVFQNAILRAAYNANNAISELMSSARRG